ncbi:MAG: hypothetical protein LWX07_03625 [Bacteroidetes bacterium]|nr:hypothetical protein [Bacteroidota bacterium]
MHKEEQEPVHKEHPEFSGHATNTEKRFFYLILPLRNLEHPDASSGRDKEEIFLQEEANHHLLFRRYPRSRASGDDKRAFKN